MDAMIRDDPSGERKREEKERGKERDLYLRSLVVYSSGVHISRRLRATTRLFTQQTYRSASLSAACIARTHRHAPGVRVYHRGRVPRLDVVDDEQSTPLSKTTRVIFIINYMASVRATPGERKVSWNRFD